MTFMDLVVPIMLFSGALGGLVNKFLLNPAEEQVLSWGKHVLVGIAAAFTVPVLLSMISSSLITDVKGELSDPVGLNSLLILAGFCLLAAISSRAFIRSLSDKILKDLVLKEVAQANKTAQEAKAVAENAEAIAELTVEPDEVSTAQIESMSTATAGAPLSAEERQVLHAVTNSRFTMRTLGGLAAETALIKSAVADIVSQLVKKGMIAAATGRQQRPLWYATIRGKLALAKAADTRGMPALDNLAKEK